MVFILMVHSRSHGYPSLFNTPSRAGPPKADMKRASIANFLMPLVT